MSISFNQRIFIGRNSFHITFVKLVRNDAGIRLPKIKFEKPLLYLLQTAVSKVEVRRQRRMIVQPWQWNKVGSITVCDLGLETFQEIILLTSIPRVLYSYCFNFKEICNFVVYLNILCTSVAISFTVIKWVAV